MFWEPTASITLLDSILFSFLSVLLLYAVGTSFHWFICTITKKVDPLQNLDFFEKINYRLLFGLAYSILFLLSFSVFPISFLTMVCLVILITIVMPIILKCTLSIRKATFKKPNLFLKLNLKSQYLDIIASSVLLVVLILTLSSIVGIFGSTNDDGAFHTTVIRTIIDNPSILLTHGSQPYAQYINAYPLGVHSISALFTVLFNVSIQKIVIMLGAMMPCLIALSFYSTTNSLFHNKKISLVGMILAAFFTTNLTWGPFAWCGVPLLFSFYTSISALGIFFVLFGDKASKPNWLSFFISGLVIFTSIEIYPVAFLFMVLWLIFISLINFKKYISMKINVKFFSIKVLKNVKLVLAFLIPILFSVPYLIIVINHPSITQQNFPADISSQNVENGLQGISEMVRNNVTFNWLLDIPKLSLFFAQFGACLSAASLTIFVIFLMFLSKKYPKISSRLASLSDGYLRNFIIIFIFYLILMSYLVLTTNFNIPYLSIFDSQRFMSHIYILGVILSAFVFYFLFCLMSATNIISNKRFTKLNYKKVKIIYAILLVGLISTVFSFSISEEFFHIYSGFEYTLNKYETLSADDLSLMLWIKENIPSDALILVTACDSGQYLTAVTQHSTIYSYDNRILSQKYNELIEILISNPQNTTAISYLKDYNISYIYIGSKATNYSLTEPYRNQFNTTKFLDVPYFSLTYSIGNASLFWFNSSIV